MHVDAWMKARGETRSVDVETPAASGRGRGPGYEPGAVATVVFAVVVVAAVPLYLWRGRHQWFYLDEWDYLVARRATSLHDLLRPHNEHWQTLPILAYRGCGTSSACTATGRIS